MSDTLDILTADEAKQAINMDLLNGDQDAVLARHVTAVSRIIDDMCGPVVVRTITGEVHRGGVHSVRVRRWPVTSFTSVTEARNGATTALTSVAFGGTGDGYYAPTWERSPSLLSGELYRWRFGCEYGWAPTQITYVAGRYADTASVDARFKDAAGAVLRRLWKREAGAWAASPEFWEQETGATVPGFFKVAKPVIEELLWDECQTHLVGFA